MISRARGITNEGGLFLRSRALAAGFCDKNSVRSQFVTRGRLVAEKATALPQRCLYEGAFRGLDVPDIE
jgi:hypothetical protein